ncbi:hypothetical protein, partial [Enterovibrio norvegicus]|uniref:hypothetical protein n=1 Tax=Enterovibrio norvegicus TaxID=188144 RepID=UPI00352C0CDF
DCHHPQAVAKGLPVQIRHLHHARNIGLQSQAFLVFVMDCHHPQAVAKGLPVQIRHPHHARNIGL